MPKKIIVCDDEGSILEVIRVILEEEGYRVRGFTNCDGLLARIKKYSPDLLILDIWMPKIDAEEAVRLLRRTKISQHIPIILISALNEGELIGKSLKVDGFLKKPFNIADLTSLVKKLLNR